MSENSFIAHKGIARAFTSAVLSSMDLLTESDLGDLTRYADDPVGFCRHVLNVRLWHKQQEILSDLVTYDRVTVRSCNGAGKTRTAGCAIMWGLLTHPNAVVVTTAPTWDQVVGQLWREIHSLKQEAPYPLPGKLTQIAYELGPKWFAIGRSTNKPERFAGFHSSPITDLQWELTDEEFWSTAAAEIAKAGGFMMAVFDESSGINPLIFEAAAGFGSTPNFKWLQIGNPTVVGGPFWKSHQTPSPEELERLTDAERRAVLWKRHHISAYDVPPRLMDPNFIKRALNDWGRNTPMFQVRVLGEFPTEGPDVLIPFWALERAVDAEVRVDGTELLGRRQDASGRYVTPCKAGVDVGAQGEGETVIYIVRGDHVEYWEAWHEEDTTKTEDRLAGILDVWVPNVVTIDIGAMGKGVADHLAARDYPVQALNWGEETTDRGLYLRLRDELWWGLRMRLLGGKLTGLTDDITRAQLSAIKWDTDELNKVRVETKKQLRSRGLKSPDRGDALVLACAPGNAGQMRAGDRESAGVGAGPRRSPNFRRRHF